MFRTSLERVAVFGAAGFGAIVSLSVSATPAHAEAAVAKVVDEIVVTARRREERLQDVPASVTSVSGERLQAAGVSQARDLDQVTPGLTSGGFGIYAQPNIRGIGTTSVLVGDEANVSTYIDGVYMSQMSSNFMKFTDIERVEVLKGPQGTLFGRNATGGAISILTQQPAFQTSGRATVGYASFNRGYGNFYLTGPLSSKVAVSLSGIYDHDDGYVRDIVFGGHLAYNNVVGIRGKLLANVTDQLTVLLSADYTDGDNLLGISSRAYNFNSAGYRLNPAAARPQPYEAALSIVPRNHIQQSGASIHIDGNVGDLKLSSITAVRQDLSKNFTDSDATTTAVSAGTARIPSYTYSQEFQASSDVSKRIQWITGVYLFRSMTEYAPFISNGTFTLRSKVNTDAAAVFGEATVNFTDKISSTAGLRYSREEKTNIGSINGAVRGPFKAHWADTTPRVVVRYLEPDQFNLYGSFSQGFKSGQFNSGDLSGVAVQPEHVDAYEVGIKSLIPGPVRASAAIFHYNYKNIQVQAYTPGGGIARLQNAAQATINGAEASLDANLSGGFTGNLHAAYNDAKYDSFPAASVTIPLTAVAPLTPCEMGTGALLGGNRQIPCDVSGRRLVRTPKFTLSGGLDYATQFAGGALTASVNAEWSDGFFWDPLNRLRQPSYTLVNARLAWTASTTGIKVALWGSNLLDRDVYATLNTSATADTVNYREPRAFGVELGYSF